MIEYREVGPIGLRGMPSPVTLYTAAAGDAGLASRGAETKSG
jgi:hypothetical protein